MSKRGKFALILSIIILILVVIFGGTFGFDAVKRHFIKKFFSTFTPPPVAVSAIKAKAETWNPSISAPGTLEAVNGVEVNSRVAGQIVAVHFRSGQMAAKGQSLIQLDAAIDKERLKTDLAQLKLTKLNYQRNLRLLKRNAISKSVLDLQFSNYQKAKAAVASDRLSIEYKNIRAPFAGKLGISKVDLGQYVTPGQALVGLQALNPLFVDFTLPQQDLNKIYQGQTVKIHSDAYPDDKFQGKIVAIDSSVTVDTRNVMIRAQFPNPGNKLLPGQFVDVSVILPAKQNVVTVPQTAISYNLYGDFIYVIVEKGKTKKGKPKLIAEQRFVKPGPRRGSVAAILSGIKKGDLVVTSGQIKLRNKAQVVINNTVSFQD